MSDFLTAIKSVHLQNNKPIESFLTEVKTNEAAPAQQNSSIQNDDSNANGGAGSVWKKERPAIATTPEDALQILRSEPDTDTVTHILEHLSGGTSWSTPFSLHATGPLQAQLVNTLLTLIVPNFWSVFGMKDKASLTACLRNVTGTNAIIARLRFVTLQSRAGKSGALATAIQECGDVASQVFEGDCHAFEVWNGLQTAVTDSIRRDLAWKEYVNLAGSGKVISTVAEAEDALKAAGGKPKPYWLSHGSEYAAWLARNIARFFTDGDGALPTAGAQLLTKSLGLGYPLPLVKALYTELLHTALRTPHQRIGFKSLISKLPTYAKRQLLEHTLRWLSSLAPSNDATSQKVSPPQDPGVSAVAALLEASMLDSIPTQQHLLRLLADSVLTTFLTFQVRRACLATLSSYAPDELQTLLERTMATFGDPLFVNHAPILQQECIAQTLLLTAGYLHRQMPMAVLMIARSSSHMQGVSNRLDASNQRARWLGMIIGTALSSLVDKEGVKMNFETADMQTGEARWYLELLEVADKVGTLQDFQDLLDAQNKAMAKPRAVKTVEMPKLNGKPLYGPIPPPKPAQTEVEGQQVTEILDSEDDEDDDDGLTPYAKPDSDPEDSDEDATLVNRHKARPPVYIRDLMSMLRDTEKHDRFQIGIRYAASLVRRKTGFGREVTDHAEELASILCGLQDPFDTEDFEEMRLQALIAVMLSEVTVMAPWLAGQAFTGEYSLAQRCVMLTALGLGGRELAGFKGKDELNPKLSNTEFPSKRLPARLHAIYGPADPSIRRLENASKSLEHQLIQPMAVQAADKSTAHLNAVKVRNFSSRMEVERTSRKPAPNQLARVFGQAFFFPLVNRYQQDVAAYGGGSVYSSAPFLLVTFLKTLALLLHASGPATLHLSQVSSDFWDLLLSLRVQATSDISVLEAVLFALLTLLEINTDKRRIADEHPKQLMDTQQWVELVFERSGGGEVITEGNGEEAKVRTLAAGVLVKTKEAIDAYQRQLVGDIMDY